MPRIFISLAGSSRSEQSRRVSVSDCCCEKSCELGLPDDNALETNEDGVVLAESHHSAGNFATLQQLVLTGAPTTFICSQWWKSDFSAKGFSHPRRSVERSALAIASAILLMPSGRFEPKPA